MLTKPTLKQQNDLNALNRMLSWLVQPRPGLSPDLHRRARFFNIVLLAELSVLLIGTPLAVVNRGATRILLTVLVFLIGAALAYFLSKTGEVLAAIWVETIASLVAISGYIISVPRTNPDTPYLDFRSTLILMALPLIIAGVVSGAKNCLILLGITLTTFMGVALVAVSSGSRPADFGFYANLVRVPFAFLVSTSLIAIIFERNIFGLLEYLNEQNTTLRKTTEELTTRRRRSEQTTDELKTMLARLRNSFQEQLAAADQQHFAVVDVGTALEELGRVARRIDNLAGQTGQVAADAVGVANQGVDVIRTNSVAYSRLQQHLELINHSVEELTLEARQIDQVVSSIGEVAEETNLLALNASIEAAGQREQGRRFATIASEVQRLAQRSRDAAEEVRRVVTLVQDSVADLAEISMKSREEAQTLLHSTRTSATTMDQIVSSIERSADSSQTMLSDIQHQQSVVISILDLIPGLSSKSEEVRRTTRQLLSRVQTLEQLVLNLRETALNPASEELTTDETEQTWDEQVPVLFGRFARGSKWYRYWHKATAPHPRLSPLMRRRSQLVNKLSLLTSIFLLFYTPLSQIAGYNPLTLFTYLALLLTMSVIFALSKAGYHTASHFGFSGSVFVGYTVNFQMTSTPLEMVDFLKTTSAFLGLLVLGMAVAAGLEWIGWVSGLSLLLLIGLAIQRTTRPLIELFPTLTSAVILLSCMSLLAVFLHRSITRLTEQLEEQNNRFNQDNRELRYKNRQELELGQQINALSNSLVKLYEEQAGLVTHQLRDINGMTGRLDKLERAAQQLVKANQQLVQTAQEALQHAMQGARNIEEGVHIIGEFQERVASIASNSADLQEQSGEIEQTFAIIIDVADEIDLLALNATVEATQAREAGKRFAAVAGEVQRLASRARAASAKVRLIIARVQEAVALCVDLTERGQHEISLLSRAATDTNRSIQDIVQITSNTSNLIEQIQEAMQQQAIAISQVSKRLHDLSHSEEVFRDEPLGLSDNITRLSTMTASLSAS